MLKPGPHDMFQSLFNQQLKPSNSALCCLMCFLLQTTFPRDSLLVPGCRAADNVANASPPASSTHRVIVSEPDVAYEFSEETFPKLKERASKGDATAALQVGRIYDLEKNDHAAALVWYRQAEKCGSGKAAMFIAFHYSVLLKPPDLRNAFDIYDKWARRGHADAMAELWKCYERGLGVPQNRTKAMEWCEKAARAGKVFSMKHLSHMLLDDKNVVAAYVWLEVASLRTKWIGPSEIKQVDTSELARRLTPDQLKEARKMAEELDRQIPHIIPWMYW